MANLDDFMGCSLSLIMVAFGLFILAGICYFSVDALQERKAYPAMSACRAKRMEPLRQPLGSIVTCVPVNTRQDTATYNLNVKP